MPRQRLLPLLLLAAVACEESSPTVFRPSEPEQPLESIPGILVAPTMLKSGDLFIELVGVQTMLFTELVGAEVLIDGVFDESDGALLIHEFMVLTVDNLPAVDGRLEETDEGFAVYPRYGPAVALAEIPGDLEDDVGKRVWLTLQDGFPVRYGVLEM